MNIKYLVLVIIAACMQYSCGSGSGDGFTIVGNVEDADGLKVVLQRVTPEGPDEMSTTEVKNGKFKITGKVDYPEFCILYIGENGPMQFFVENTEIHLEIDIENMQDSRVTGSRENDLLSQFYDIMAIFDEKANEIQNNYMMLMFSGEEIGEEKENEFAAQFEAIRLEVVDFMSDFAQNNTNSVLVALIIDSYLSPHMEPADLEVYVVDFDEIVSQSPWVQMLVERVEAAKLLALGQPYIDVKLPSPDGEEIAISDLAGKGNYLLLDFWASWCQPCRVVNPQLVKLYDKYKDKGFDILGISLDNDRDAWIQAIEDDKLAWSQISDLSFWQSEAARAYSITSIPHTILLDKDGMIIGRGLSFNEIEEKLEELLGN